MANLLLIEKQPGGYFKFTLNGDSANAVTSIQNDLLAVGNQLHFKTGNGANIIKEQFIYPEDVTIISGGTYTFTTVAQVWTKLIDIDYFAWLGTGSGGGIVDRFSELIDTFQYVGNAGKAVVVDNSELKLIPITLHNISTFTELTDTPDALVPNKMVVVNNAGNALILQDQPTSPEQFLNSVGYFDYNDLVTQTTPLTAVANVPLKLTNDTAGANTNTSQNPYGVSYVWDSTTNQFHFAELAIGDTIDIRVHVQVTTTSANQKISLKAKFGIGSAYQFENSIYSGQFKTAGLNEISFVAPFYIGSTLIRDYPAELTLITDAGATVKVDGWYVRILRKNINIITVDYAVPDATSSVKGVVRLGGDLSGTANTPTVPGLATKVPNTRSIGTTAPLLGGGTLNGDLILSIPQANSIDSGYLSFGDWTHFNEAYNDKVVSIAVSGTTTKTLTITQQDGGTLTTSWTDDNSVTSVFGRIGAVVATIGDYTTSQVTEGTNLYYTNTRVSANTDVAANTAARHNAVTLGTANGLGLAGQILSLGLATATLNGALSATDWATFNGKANDASVVHLAGTETITGAKTFENLVKLTGNGLSSGYAMEFDCATVDAIAVKQSGVQKLVVRTNGEILAQKYIIDGGFSTQFLKANGTLDSNVYALDSAVVHLSGSETITGVKTFTSAVKAPNFVLSGGTGNTGMYFGHTDRLVLANYTVGGGIDFESNGGVINGTLFPSGNWGFSPSAVDDTINRVQVGGYVIATGYRIPSGTSSQFLKADGSVDSNTYALTSQLHNAVTIGTANGLSLSTQVLSLGLASSSANGALSSTDWTTFNNKQNSLTNPITGTGTTNYIPKFTGANTLADSVISQTAYGIKVQGSAGGDTLVLDKISGASVAFNVNGVYTGQIGAVGNDLYVGSKSVYPAIVVKDAGNVGIGTTSPDAPLGFANALGDKIKFNSGSGNSYKIGLVAAVQGGDALLKLSAGESISAGEFGFYSGSSYKMFINNSGNVGIGTTSPQTALDVNGVISITASVPYIQWKNTSNTRLGYIQHNATDLVMNADIGGIAFSNTGGERMRIKSTGAVNVANLGTGLVYSNAGDLTSTNPSDSRLKDNITDLQYGLNEILQLRPVSYDWKNDVINQGKQYGFIAQEVQEIMPELVKEFETKDGEEDVVRLGLDKEGIYAALVNAIKELKEEIEILKSK